ncbi:hypothetical protein LIER_26272 [Lithospermum erythrorhizon]|uniref:Bromo domain-containing protein n=1 Tax=Lithospermum erythrorhizon TaxID=34254 RepID=A0AAV3RB57_LITER
MKRKRGRKSKSKKAEVSGTDEVSNVGSNVEEDCGVDEGDNDDVDFSPEAETPPSMGNNPIASPAVQMDTVSVAPMDNKVVKAVYSRVRVKIKSSKALEPQPASSEPRAHSDTDKSSLQVSLDKQVVTEKMEDSANSLPESNLNFENPPKKIGGIRIKSSKGLSSSTPSPCATNELGNGDSKQEKDPEDKKARYNKQELTAAIEVIKKVMKTDAAQPFNAPVDPIALGIPDYFDVIDTPMDFGTICSNLEKGLKYMNSEDVYRDVRFIWDNCYKYNNKGDFIVGLMKRVKKNFMSMWITAGLYIELPQGYESNMKDATPSSDGTTPEKGVLASQLTRKMAGYLFYSFPEIL